MKPSKPATGSQMVSRGNFSEILGSSRRSELAKSILACTRCETLNESAARTVRPFVKPCAESDIYINWKPERVKVVFIAEAPPGKSDGYFYDPRRYPGYKETLRTALFSLLELVGTDISAKLAEFKGRGYFLVDAIKCRCKKTNGQPPKRVTETCARRWLQQELEEIGKPDRICALGKAALLALSQLAGFEHLSRYSVTDDCGEVVDANQRKVLIWPFLGWRNERIYTEKIHIFKEFCYVSRPRTT